MRKNSPDLSVGILYDAIELIELISENLTIQEIELKSAFPNRFSSADLQSVLEISQSCNWFCIDTEGILFLTNEGRLILDADNYKAKLRIQIKHFVNQFRPPWALILKNGRTALSSLPEDCHQCLNEAGFLELNLSGLNELDRLIAIADGGNDYNKIAIGRKGELLTKKYEEIRTGESPKWIALDTNLAGYDFLSIVCKDDTSPLPIEVKTTERDLDSAYIHISKNESDISLSAKNYIFYIWLLNPIDFYIVDPEELAKHRPTNKGYGTWESVKIPLKNLIHGDKKLVTRIDVKKNNLTNFSEEIK